MSDIAKPTSDKPETSGKKPKRKLTKRQIKARKLLQKKITSLDESIKRSLDSSALVRRQKARIKKRNKALLIIGGIGALIALVNYVFKPFNVHFSYGVCRAFLELQVEYPDTLRYLYVGYLPKRTRIWYIEYNSFGNKSMDHIDCFFSYPGGINAHLHKVEINRSELDGNVVRRFNETIPSVIHHMPDYTFPNGGGMDIKTLE